LGQTNDVRLVVQPLSFVCSHSLVKKEVSGQTQYRLKQVNKICSRGDQEATEPRASVLDCGSPAAVENQGAGESGRGGLFAFGNLSPPEHKTFQGRCLAILRPGGRAGKIALRVEADGVESNAARFERNNADGGSPSRACFACANEENNYILFPA
jgi:hypothetical protein